MYKLGFRPKPGLIGSIFYSPSNDLTYAFSDRCNTRGDSDEGYCMCIKHKSHMRRGEPHACVHGSWR